MAVSRGPDARLREVIESQSAELAARIPLGTGNALYRYLLRILVGAGVDDAGADAEEIYSAFLLKVLRRFKKCGAGDIQGAAWFYEVLRSAVADVLCWAPPPDPTKTGGLGRRVEGDTRVAASIEHALNGQAALDLADGGSDEELFRTLTSYLRKLAPREREVLVYALVLRYATPRIAEAMNLKASTVATLRYQALLKLKRHLLRAIEDRK